jgi:hypothetical protein
MAHHVEFNRILDRLYKRRTDRLRRIIKPKAGKVRTLTKRHREKALRRLEGIVSLGLAEKLAKRAFEKSVAERKSWRPKGWRAEKKLDEFRKWTRRKTSRKRGKVYVFWQKRKCRYIGRTGGRGSRPTRHFGKNWFAGTTRIDVYTTLQRRNAPRLECLAIHRFQPTKNKVKAARKGWTPHCPLCSVHRVIRKEIRKIYRFR